MLVVKGTIQSRYKNEITVEATGELKERVRYEVLDEEGTRNFITDFVREKTYFAIGETVEIPVYASAYNGKDGKIHITLNRAYPNRDNYTAF